MLLLSQSTPHRTTLQRKTQCELRKKPHATVLHRFPPKEKKEDSMKETVKATNNCEL